LGEKKALEDGERVGIKTSYPPNINIYNVLLASPYLKA
jgi:hypothetical protein